MRIKISFRTFEATVPVSNYLFEVKKLKRSSENDQKDFAAKIP
jgi:hypothetical protein